MKLHRRCGMTHVGVASALLLALPLVAPVGAQGASAGTPAAGALKYPPSPRGGQVDELAGTRVADPYRWLENVAAPEVRSWVAAQNAVTEGVLGRIPRRGEIKDLVTRAWNYP